MDNYYVSKDKKGWRLDKQGSKRASVRADTKVDMLQKTSEFMSDKVGSVKIKKTDGRFQEERTYQRKNDPTKSPG